VAITTAGSSPTYSNTINRIHAVEFDGSPNKHFTFDGSFLNNTDYTIFVLEKRQDPKGDNYFLGEVGSGLNNSLALGYSADNQIIHAQGTNSYPAGISTYSNSKDKPRVFAFVHSAANGNQTYVNGVLAAENADPAAQAHLTAIDTVAIGKGYVGEIGELAIFTKALSATDRTSIEDYLGKKWTSSINRAKSPNCIGGLVTIGGCDNSSPVTCSASGTGYSQTGLTYTSGSSFACNVSGFTGTISYKCLASGPASNITGSCTATICSAPAGTGYLAQTGLPYAESGAGTFACDTASGFVGALNYTCTASGLATNITGSCGCDSANGYSLVGGVCVGQCLVSVNGSSISSVPHGATQVACDGGAGYASTPFTFSACSGSAISGSCSCNTGYAGSTCSTCDTANNYVSGSGGTCVLEALSPCTVSGTANGTHTLDNSTVSGSTIHIFTSNGSANGTFTLNCPSTRNAQVLVVGGGGGGAGGGGGGGGVVYNSSVSLPTTPISVVVGIGGLGKVTASTIGANGSNSSFDSIIAYGGGGGGKTQGAGASGASSGGCGQDNTLTSGAATQGYRGASGISNVGGSGAGGGGGAGGTGYQGYTLTAYNAKYGLSGQNTAGGNGGAGASSTILNNSTIYYGGGGGGGANNNGISQVGRSEGLGGVGGGGNGALANRANGTSGASNTGGGGGDWEANGGNGGSGIVIVRYVN
jgi:mucin-19